MEPTMSETRRVDEIVVGQRSRADMGNILALAGSIKDIGLLHPVTINRRNELIAGGRRLAAARELGWETIAVRVVDCLDDALLALKAEMDENTCRKNLTPLELVEHGRRLEELERPKARERKGGHPSDNPTEGKFPSVGHRSEGGKVRDKVAAALGCSGKTYEKAKAVVTAAESDQEKFGDLPAKMEAAGKVDPAYRELQERQADPAPPGDSLRAVKAVLCDAIARLGRLDPQAALPVIDKLRDILAELN